MTRLRIAMSFGVATFAIGILLRTFGPGLVQRLYPTVIRGGNEISEYLSWRAVSVEAGWWAMGWGAVIVTLCLGIWVNQGFGKTELHE